MKHLFVGREGAPRPSKLTQTASRPVASDTAKRATSSDGEVVEPSPSRKIENMAKRVRRNLLRTHLKNNKPQLTENPNHSKGKSTGGLGCSICFRLLLPGFLPNAAHSNKATNQHIAATKKSPMIIIDGLKLFMLP